MAYKSKFLASLPPKAPLAESAPEDNTLAELMSNPDYLRYSSTVINEALKDGFDVLQLPNGDIVATGTKTIVNTYVWDAENNRLEKTRTSGEKPRAVRKAKARADMEEEAAE